MYKNYQYLFISILCVTCALRNVPDPPPGLWLHHWHRIGHRRPLPPPPRCCPLVTHSGNEILFYLDVSSMQIVSGILTEP